MTGFPLRPGAFTHTVLPGSKLSDFIGLSARLSNTFSGLSNTFDLSRVFSPALFRRVNQLWRVMLDVRFELYFVAPTVREEITVGLIEPHIICMVSISCIAA